jgi:hypothetical protein
MRLPKPIHHGFTGLALVSLLAAGCGGSDDDGNGAQIDAGDTTQIDAANGNDIDADVEDNLFTYVSQITIPAIEDDVPVCCRDFTGDDEVDNAYAQLVANIADQFDIEFQDGIDFQLEQGILALVGEHVGLEGTSGTFTLNALRGNFAGTTDYDRASAGDGVFTIDDLSYDNAGNPRLSFSAEIAGGELSASAQSVVLLLPIGDNALPLPTHDVVVEATANVSEDSASYSDGQFSGFFRVDEVFAAFNNFLSSDQCGCLDLEAGTSVFEQDNGDWTAANCAATPTCDGLGEGLCGALGGTGDDGLLCAAIPGLIQGVADLNGDGTEAGTDAISVGFQWAGVPTEVTGN